MNKILFTVAVVFGIFAVVGIVKSVKEHNRLIFGLETAILSLSTVLALFSVILIVSDQKDARIAEEAQLRTARAVAVQRTHRFDGTYVLYSGSRRIGKFDVQHVSFHKGCVEYRGRGFSLRFDDGQVTVISNRAVSVYSNAYIEPLTPDNVLPEDIGSGKPEYKRNSRKVIYMAVMPNVAG